MFGEEMRGSWVNDIDIVVIYMEIKIVVMCGFVIMELYLNGEEIFRYCFMIVEERCKIVEIVNLCW